MRKMGALIASLVAVTIPVGASGAYATHEDDADVNNNSEFVQVYVNNVENRPKAHWPACRGDHRDLIYYMKRREYSPDLFLVQQIRHQKQLDNLTDFMTKKLDGIYDNVIAVPNPKVDIPNKCGGMKKDADQRSHLSHWSI